MSSSPFPDNNMQRAQAEAIARARAHLANADLAVISRRTGLSVHPGRGVEVELLGRKLLFDPATLQVSAWDAMPVSATEELLLLRYLAAVREVRPTGELIAFRDLPGGNFYLQPILGRTTQMLLKRFANNIGALRHALAQYPHRPLDLGDLSAAVPAIGPLELTLVYRLGDEEFEPTADILFDRAIVAVFHTDEIAALVHWFCRGLVRAPA